MKFSVSVQQEEPNISQYMCKYRSENRCSKDRKIGVVKMRKLLCNRKSLLIYLYTYVSKDEKIGVVKMGTRIQPDISTD